MRIKDKVVSSFIKNIIIPRNEIIDTPGFIILKISMQKEVANIRELLLPESMFAEIESEIIKKYKNKGENALYSTGKKFCFRYGLISQYPTTENIKNHSNFSYFLVRYLEAIYSSKIEHKIDYKKKIFNMKMWDYIVCRNNGIGLIFSDGAGAGLISYAFSNPNIEGVQVKCQGRGDRYCEIICAPQETLKKMKIKFLSETNMNNLELEESYNDINSIRKTEYSRTSFQDLINTRFFTQRTGIIKHNDERFLLLESSIMYILEDELKKLKSADKLLFNISFKYGKKLVEKESKENFEMFIMDFLGASGFGDILILEEKRKYKVIIRYFPWSRWVESTDFTMIRGIISGMLSRFLGKKIILKKVEKDISQGYFSVVFEE